MRQLIEWNLPPHQEHLSGHFPEIKIVNMSAAIDVDRDVNEMDYEKKWCRNLDTPLHCTSSDYSHHLGQNLEVI